MCLAEDRASGVENARHHGRIDIRQVAFQRRRAIHLGTPASMMLSLSATVRPLNLPEDAP